MLCLNYLKLWTTCHLIGVRHVSKKCGHGVIGLRTAVEPTRMNRNRVGQWITCGDVVVSSDDVYLGTSI